MDKSADRTLQNQSTAAKESGTPVGAKNSKNNENNRSFCPYKHLNNRLNSQSPHCPLYYAQGWAISASGPQPRTIKTLVTGLEKGQERRHTRSEDGIKPCQGVDIGDAVPHFRHIEAQLKAMG